MVEIGLLRTNLRGRRERKRASRQIVIEQATAIRHRVASLRTERLRPRRTARPIRTEKAELLASKREKVQSP